MLNSFYNKGQGLIGVIIVLAVVGLIGGSLYYYFFKQIPEVSEITKKPIEEIIPLSSSLEGKATSTPILTPTPTSTFPFTPKPMIQKCADGTLDMQCSVTKPLYCQNLKLVNTCMSCGCPDGMVCQQDNSCVFMELELGKKVYILNNGDPRGKLDLLFIPRNVSDFSVLESNINNILFNTGITSLFNTEPFKSHQSQFNISYVDKNINEIFFDCPRDKPDLTKPIQLRFFVCNNNKIKEVYARFDPDYIVVISNDSEHISSAGEILYLNESLGSSLVSYRRLGRTFVHEFGHQFGGLVDEYAVVPFSEGPCRTSQNYECFKNYAEALKIYPNLDTIGCPKWCKSYDINKDTSLTERNKFCGAAKNSEECKTLTSQYGCVWFELEHPFFNSHCITELAGNNNIGINCDDNTGCYFGGDYGQLAFNPGGSVMSGSTMNRGFNEPSKKHLESILKCCYSRQETDFCNNFRNKFKDIPVSALVGSIFRTVYNKIISCP